MDDLCACVHVWGVGVSATCATIVPCYAAQGTRCLYIHQSDDPTCIAGTVLMRSTDFLSFLSCAVVVAVIVFQDRFGPINGVGLGVVILGVVLFNYHKYVKHMAQVGTCDWQALTAQLPMQH